MGRFRGFYEDVVVMAGEGVQERRLVEAIKCRETVAPLVVALKAERKAIEPANVESIGLVISPIVRFALRWLMRDPLFPDQLAVRAHH